MPAEAIYEKDAAIEFIYRCNGDPATASPTVKVLNPTKTEVLPAPTLTQVVGTRLWGGSFTPDAEGVWTLHGEDVHGGDMAKDFPVGALGVQSGMQFIKTAVILIDGKIDILDSKIDDLAADVADAGGAHFA